jgi:hypothetical protein
VYHESIFSHTDNEGNDKYNIIDFPQERDSEGNDIITVEVETFNNDDASGITTSSETIENAKQEGRREEREQNLNQMKSILSPEQFKAFQIMNYFRIDNKDGSNLTQSDVNREFRERLDINRDFSDKLPDYEGIEI